MRKILQLTKKDSQTLSRILERALGAPKFLFAEEARLCKSLLILLLPEAPENFGSSLTSLEAAELAEEELAKGEREVWRKNE
mgnify:CR=1 FL=1